MKSFFDNKIEFLKGVGPKRAEQLNLELNIFTFNDLLMHYPFRYVDRTRFHKINEVNSEHIFYQIAGIITGIAKVSRGYKSRLTATFKDDTGEIDLLWFAGIDWFEKRIKPGQKYIVLGKPNQFLGVYSFTHPEMEVFPENGKLSTGLDPVYNTTEKLKLKGMDSKGFRRYLKTLFEISPEVFPETLPDELTKIYKLCPRKSAFYSIHFPSDEKALNESRRRLKFEELFYIQIKILSQKFKHHKEANGKVFKLLNPHFMSFYEKHLPFNLTEAQKNVIREIRNDMLSGIQMNRLLQGDVGSGKTMVAFMAILIALDNFTQTCLMAPTEILATQHYYNLKEYTDPLGIDIELLTGSTGKKRREKIYAGLENGELKIITGTHALIEDKVKFKELGLCIIDEQHRFGVEQRSKLWSKGVPAPHILVMTATPIPRTLAMTLYGDLDYSVIDEMPEGRLPIITSHRYDTSREKIYHFVKEQIGKGFQVYIVYPLIDESEKLDFKHLMEGYELIRTTFPDFGISMVHGQMKSKDKDFEMQRFVKGETQIMVATNVIEVGVNVPNAVVMIIESAERFGLSQLHQLRGRVGRGTEKSYCILMTGEKLSSATKLRMETLTRTNDGFEIADIDLKLRGPGDMMGTQQSGLIDELKLSSLSEDKNIVEEARKCAHRILEKDPELLLPENKCIMEKLNEMNVKALNWAKIS